MGEATKIEWTDHTFNPIRGCEHATLPDGSPHPGCEHCYAEAMSGRNPGTLGEWGSEAEGGRRVRGTAEYWRLPLKWNRFSHEHECGLEATKLGNRWYCQTHGECAGNEIHQVAFEPGRHRRKRVFCASLADIFEDWQGQIHGAGRDDGTLAIDDNRSRLLTMDDCRRDLFGLIDLTPNLDWLLLTKRPQNVRKMWMPVRGARDLGGDVGTFTAYRPNVYLGTSVSDQATADALVPELLKCRDLSPVLFLSVEPLLGPVTIGVRELDQYINWVIVGGESGSHARRFDAAWAYSLIDQCKAAGVPCFVKQLGGNAWSGDLPLELRDKKGGDWSEWPEDLRVRQFPEVSHGT